MMETSRSNVSIKQIKSYEMSILRVKEFSLSIDSKINNKKMKSFFLVTNKFLTPALLKYLHISIFSCFLSPVR